jgi:RecA-family ATPase
MDKQDAIKAFEEFAAGLRKDSANGEYRPNPPIDLIALRDMEFNYDWLVEGFWPMGAHLHIFAAPKTGKSLVTLWIACCIAKGIDPFNGQTMERKRVSYIDNEMTLRDVRDRIADMNWEFEELDGWLLYHQYPVLPPMDTEMGGVETMAMMHADDSSILIIDTLSRVVKGEENSNDTYRNFYNHTGRVLKANGVTMCRLDHAGHDPKKSRGASAKADDVDLVYGLEKRDNGYRLQRTHARVSNVREQIDLAFTDEPISIRQTGMRLWTAQALTKAKELDALDAPLNVSQREAIKLLKGAGIGPGKTVYLSEAIHYRQSVTARVRGFE